MIAVTQSGLSRFVSGFTSFGGSVGLIIGDGAETAHTISRCNDLSTDNRVWRLTFYGLGSYYYSVGPGGMAPFAVTEIGLGGARQSQSQAGARATVGGKRR